MGAAIGKEFDHLDLFTRFYRLRTLQPRELLAFGKLRRAGGRASQCQQRADRVECEVLHCFSCSEMEA